MRNPEIEDADWQVLDVLDEGPETIPNISGETGLSVALVRRSIHKLKFLGYIKPRFLDGHGQCKAATFYEHVRTRKAA